MPSLWARFQQEGRAYLQVGLSGAGGDRDIGEQADGTAGGPGLMGTRRTWGLENQLRREPLC